MNKNIEKEILEILPSVSKPGRYIGSEWNAEKKDPEGKLRIALCFPDIYEMGMSYLGFKILYHLLNSYPDVYCERVFAPWIDLEAILREKKMPLFSLETKTPLRDFDIVAFSVNYELNYTNILNMLSLGGIPLRRSERHENDPFVIAGGPSTANPAPISEFFDAFFIGEAEEGMAEIIDAAVKNLKIKRDKVEFLKEISRINSIFIPGKKEKAEKQFVKNFETSFYPAKQIVPLIEIIHDRISLEIMRGCPNRCRFCQAGAIYRPLRIRSVDRILEIAKDTYKFTGYEEISLLSLSSGEHPKILEILNKLIEEFKASRVSISMPSLKTENLVKNFPKILGEIKKTGLTLALESGSERIRKLLNKNIDEKNLLEILSFAFENGWQHLKLYLMVGLPGETDEDIKETIKFINKLSNLTKKRHYISLSVSSFVPKPFTPFQWRGMSTPDELVKKQQLLYAELKGLRNVEIKFHDIKTTFLEAVFSRGDASLSEAIFEAWSLGAKFDSWREGFKSEIWDSAFKKLNIDPLIFACRNIPYDSDLPWDSIDMGIDKALLKAEAETLAYNI